MSKEDLKMSDVFNLPVHQNESEFFGCVLNMPDCKRAIGQMNSSEWSKYIAHAINNHDKLKQEIDEAVDELEACLSLLTTAFMCSDNDDLECDLNRIDNLISKLKGGK